MQCIARTPALEFLLGLPEIVKDLLIDEFDLAIHRRGGHLSVDAVNHQAEFLGHIDEAGLRRILEEPVLPHSRDQQVGQTVLAEHNGNIDNIRMSRQSPDFTELTIDLEVYNLKHLTSIISQLRAKKVVAKADRVNG